jgi:hypothetical protein
MTLKQHPLLQWSILFFLLMLFSYLTGRLQVKTVPDSASYLQYPFDSLDAALRSTRTFGYPLLLRVISSTFSLSFLPAFQVLIHATACWWMLRELFRWPVTNVVSWAAALAIAFSPTTLDNVSIISTDSVAASLGVMTAACLLAWARAHRSNSQERYRPVLLAVVASLLALSAIAMRPAYLSLIVWLPAAGTLLLTMRCADAVCVPWKRAIRSSTLLAMLVLIPILAWIAFRGVLVGDFAMLPFGHQNLAGITIQLVSDEELASTPAPADELAKQIIAKKNSHLESSCYPFSRDDRSTMAMEARWDDYVWLVVVPATSSLQGNDAIANHKTIAALNRDIIQRFPVRYARWVLLAMRRAIWGTVANIAMHPIYLPCLLFVLAWYVWRLHGGIFVCSSGSSEGIRALHLIAITYFFVQVGFVVLSSPPLGRFADAAAIFIPASIAAILVQCIHGNSGTTRIAS